jgi:hypothetical protein
MTRVIIDHFTTFLRFVCGCYSEFMLSIERGSFHRFLRYYVHIRIGRVDVCIDTGSMACVEHNAEHSISHDYNISFT